MKKICSKCKVEKDLDLFAKRPDRPSGVRPKCKQCEAAIYAEWRTKNKERKNAINNRYYQNNKEKVLAANANWRSENKDKLLAMWRTYQKRFPEKGSHAASKRRSVKLRAVPSWFEEDKIAVLYEKAASFGLEVDHIVPLQGKTVCGLHCWANLQLLDPSLNASKGNRYWPDMPD